MLVGGETSSLWLRKEEEGSRYLTRALIVEDNATSRMVLEKVLSEFADCQTAASGLDSVASLESGLSSDQNFHLVCLDIDLPDMDGHAVLQQLRDIEDLHGVAGLKGVKVVMTTSLKDAKNVLGAFRAGCEGYVVKPVDREKIVEQLLELELVEARELSR